jgi:protein gp37
MSYSTKIQWTDSTVNPTTGCDGCELWDDKNQACYAGILTNRFGASNPGLATDFNVISLAPGRVADAAKWRDLRGVPRPKKPWIPQLPRMIFVGDMADTFSKGVSLSYLHEEVIVPVMSEAGRRHQWQWLTKRPNVMAKLSAWLENRAIPWPENLWAGTSVTTQSRTSRIDALFDVGNERTLRFVSVEPQWESINLRPWLSKLHWVIQGGNSGSHKFPFAREWADNLRQQCAEQGVPYFLKQFGNCITKDGVKITGLRGHNGNWEQWPEKYRVRQFPIYTVRPNPKLRQLRV